MCYRNALKNAMENIRNLELARLHRNIQNVITNLKHLPVQTEKLLDVIDQLDAIETRLQNFAYGDCQFLHRLPYAVKPSVKRGRLIIYPKPPQGEVA